MLYLHLQRSRQVSRLTPAGMSLAHFVLSARMLYRTTPPLRAQKFPEATSFRICFSNDSSATKRFSFAFSRSSPFIRFA